MSEKIFDWKGNEIKAGMTIYFVQTKKVSWGRMGLMMPDGKGGHSRHWESDEDYEKRKEEEKEEIWHLGQPYTVEDKEGILVYTTMPNEDGETYSGPFSMGSLFGEKPMIAIKGISDKK